MLCRQKQAIPDFSQIHKHLNQIWGMGQSSQRHCGAAGGLGLAPSPLSHQNARGKN